MVILLDNGHGVNTKGKCSPDKRLKEYAYTRELTKMIYEKLNSFGHTAILVTPEETDISLRIRVDRINKYCKKYGTKNCILISVHCNAAGSDGKWHTASGWSDWIGTNASNKSKVLGKCLYEQAEKYKLQGNRYVPKEKYWTANYYICNKSNCPAVLTENLFQDNREEVDWILTDKGKQTLVDLHVNGIINYIDTIK